MFDLFINLKSGEFKNQKINYYMMLIYREIKNMAHQNAIRCNDFQNLCHSELNSPHETVGLILESKFCCSCESGIDILFRSGNPDSKRLAEILEKNFKSIFENPCDKVNILSQNGKNSAESPIVTLRFNFSCRINKPEWILKNIEGIPATVTMSITEFFGIPFIPYKNQKIGFSKTDAVVFKRPNNNSEIVQTVEPGEKIAIISQWEDWYVIKKNNFPGFIHSKFINI